MTRVYVTFNVSLSTIHVTRKTHSYHLPIQVHHNGVSYPPSNDLLSFSPGENKNHRPTFSWGFYKFPADDTRRQQLSILSPVKALFKLPRFKYGMQNVVSRRSFHKFQRAFRFAIINARKYSRLNYYDNRNHLSTNKKPEIERSTWSVQKVSRILNFRGLRVFNFRFFVAVCWYSYPSLIPTTSTILNVHLIFDSCFAWTCFGSSSIFAYSKKWIKESVSKFQGGTVNNYLEVMRNFHKSRRF